jgi:flavin-dependent dehydrogenase
LIFFSEDIPGGYGWIFPKRDVANVGVGVDKEFGKSPKEVLDKFLEKVQDIVHKKVLKMHAGLIPVSGMDVLEEKGILFVGDAAAMAHPVTGAGVSNAFLAASILAEAVLEGRDVAKRYKRECLSFFGSIFGHALKRRELFLSVWREGKKLSSVLEKVWVGFRDYYE